MKQEEKEKFDIKDFIKEWNWLFLAITIVLIAFFVSILIPTPTPQEPSLCQDNETYELVNGSYYNCCYDEFVCLNNGRTDKCYYEVQKICEGYDGK